MSEESIVLIERSPADPDEAAAVTYMLRKLDARIQEEVDEWRSGAPSASLKSLLELRYGALPALRKKSGQDPLNVVKGAISTQRKPLTARLQAYPVDWNEQREQDAITWFKHHLQAIWPPEVHFLAEDLPTLHAACRAMDLAPTRTVPLRDDPFPAAPVLITGPTGSGKELLATAIHLKSNLEPPPRKPGPRDVFALQKLGALNCGGLPTELLESELFGHVEGAFTGATRLKEGFVEVYKDGTLFLDEIGDMPQTVQVRLLRFLNNGEFRRVGDNKSRRATPRIISATHVNLEAKVEKGEFREDLFYRVRGDRIRVRGLKERPFSARHRLIKTFLHRESERREQREPTMTRRLWTALIVYEWPGNLRELRYVVECLVAEGKTSRVLDLEDVSVEIGRCYREKTSLSQQDVLAALAVKERGEAARSTFVLWEALKERFEEEKKREDTRAATLKKASVLLGRLMGSFGLEKQLSHQVKALDLASQQSVCAQFEVCWLSPIQQAAEKEGLDTEQAIKLWREELVRVSAPLDIEMEELKKQMAEANETYGVSSLFATLVRAADTGEVAHAQKILGLLNTVAEMAEVPPMDEGLRVIAERVKGLSPAQLKTQVNEFLRPSSFRENESEFDVEEQSNGPSPKASWKRLRTDLPGLLAFIEEHGTVRAAAHALGISPETLSRTKSRLEGERGN